MIDNQDGPKSKSETQLTLDSVTTGAPPPTEEVEDNDENLNSGNLSTDNFKKRYIEESDLLEATKLKPLSNGHSSESNRTKDQEDDPKQIVNKENGRLAEPGGLCKSRDNSNFTSPLKSNYNVNRK